MDTLLPQNIPGASSAIIMWLTEGVLLGTALAALTWLLIRVLPCRKRAAIEVALWSIVLLKFLIPIGPASSFSLTSLCVRLTRHSLGPLISGDLQVLVPVAKGFAADAGAPVGALVTSVSFNWMTAIATLYVTTALVLLTIRIRGYRGLAARCRALPAADAATCSTVARLCRELRPRCVPSVRVDRQSSTTFLIGLLRPLIVVSGHQLARPRELETVIVHELAHLKRGDVLVGCLQWSASTLLFFWPVVTWVNRRIDEARESACDAWALRHGTLTAAEYARCLLGAIRPKAITALAYHPPCMAGRPSAIERRINIILQSADRSVTGRVRRLPAFLLVLAWGMFTLTGAVHGKLKFEDADSARIAAENAFRAHLAEVMSQVAEYDIADLDGNGELSYWEKTTFVTTLALSQAQALVKAYPYADIDRNGKLHVAEACDFVRGLTLIRQIERQNRLDLEAAIENGEDKHKAERATKAKFSEAQWAANHEALDAQQWLLSRMTAAPSRRDLLTINDFIEVVREEEGK